MNTWYFSLKSFLVLAGVSIVTCALGIYCLSAGETELDKSIEGYIKKRYFLSNNNADVGTQTGSTSLASVDEIKVKVIAKNLSIQSRDALNLTYEVSGIGDKLLSIEESSGVLTISSLDEEDMPLCECELTLYLPSNFAGEIQAATVSGDIDAEIASKDPGRQYQKVTLGSVSGDIEVRTSVLDRNLDVETVSGDLEMHLPKDASLTYHLETVSGDVEVNYGAVKQSATGKLSGQLGQGDFILHAQTTSGDIEVNAE